MMLYVAYGSNMDPIGMQYRCPAATRVGVGVLCDWQLVFRGVADIRPERGAVTPVAVWDITARCLKSLDTYEGYPSYYVRRPLSVHLTAGGVVEGLTYIMTEPSPLRPPSERYIETIRRGYRFWDCPVDELDDAEDQAYDSCFQRGATGFVADGRKRLQPVFDEEEAA